MNEKLCKNCNNIVKNNYCDTCGQPIKTDRIDSQYLFHELQHSILHVDKGIFFTIKELIIHPGEAIANYLQGKRVNYFKPFGFVVILATIYGFIAHFLNAVPEVEITDRTKELNDPTRNINIQIFEWIYSHYSLCMLFSIPILSLSTFLVYKRYNYNYFEHIVIHAYIIGMHCIIYTLLLPLLSIVSPFYYNNIAYILSLIYSLWVYTQLFKSGNRIKTFLSAFLGLFVSNTLLSFIIFFIISIWVAYSLYH